MFIPFFALVMLNGVIGVLAFLAIRRVVKHMRENPEASKLVAEHVIAPLLTGLLPGKAEKPSESENGSSV